MCRLYISLLIVISLHMLCCGQVTLFGKCANIKPMEYFALERFLGKWYTIKRFPTWYDDLSQCTYKLVQQCGRTIEIQHGFVKNGIEYILHVNSSYVPGAEAVFTIPENNIDPFGIPLSILRTDYSNYAIVYGCKFNPQWDIIHVLVWILSRNTTLASEILDSAYQELDALPTISLAYMQTVDHKQDLCNAHWTAHVQAIYYNNTDKDP